ncbi:MAG: hypothetical protein LRY46_01905 [Candidatus Pacebacteria bacterium]|nr:hypothetical protein [Candidatus Paceibacterota bacterium]
MKKIESLVNKKIEQQHEDLALDQEPRDTELVESKFSVMKKRALAAAFGLLHAFSAMAGSAGTQADAFDNKAHEDFQKNFKTEQERVATQKTADKSTVYFSDFSQYEPEIITKQTR